VQFAEEHLKLFAVFADGQRDQRGFDKAHESFAAVYNQEARIRPGGFDDREIVAYFSTEPPISLKPPFTDCSDPCSFCMLAA
jgi:hypothetical protein